MPTYFKGKEPPIISYTYTKTIASKIFNFLSALSDIDYYQFHSNPPQCECNTSSRLYQPFGHVITGDLSIIPNSNLRDMIAKGPKYREPRKIDWDKNLTLSCEAVDQYALQWAKRETVEFSVLSSWKEVAKGQIEERISKLKQNFKQPTVKVLQNADVKARLADIHDKYVFLPADKAPNNIIIICKSITLKISKNWDWIIAPLQPETQPTFYVKCQHCQYPRYFHEVSWWCCLMMTRDYITYIGPPSCINLQ